MNLIVDEIKTFNKGLVPIGTPYQASSRERRISPEFTSGTVIIAFPNEDQAQRAINNRLLIAGISAKVVKYINTPSTVQCNKCAGFGHSELFCKRDYKCILCADNYMISNHYCTICKKKGTKYNHTVIKYTNCNSTSHAADSKLYEVFIAIKNKNNNQDININKL